MCANALYAIFFHLHYVLVKEYFINQGIFLKHRDSEICVKWIPINQGVGVYFMNFYFWPCFFSMVTDLFFCLSKGNKS